MKRKAYKILSLQSLCNYHQFASNHELTNQQVYRQQIGKSITTIKELNCQSIDRTYQLNASYFIMLLFMCFTNVVKYLHVLDP